MAGGPHVSGEKKANAIAAMTKTLRNYHAGQKAIKNVKGGKGVRGRRAAAGAAFAFGQIGEAISASAKAGKALTKKGRDVAGAGIHAGASKGGFSPKGAGKRGAFMEGTTLQAKASGKSRNERLMSNLKAQTAKAMKVGRRTKQSKPANAKKPPKPKAA